MEGLVIRRHAVAWLVFANLLGLLAAGLLLSPATGLLSWVFNYGRIVVVHTNVQLYGWCAIPLAGLLVHWCRGGSQGRGGRVRLVFGLWSLALGLGVVSWLAGQMTGKPFMEWAGWARLVMPVAMLGLWVQLAEWVELGAGGSSRVVKLVVLALLLPVPFLFYSFTAPAFYPAINPDSGGATGTSLLRSTLGFVAIYGLAPELLGLTLKGPSSRRVITFVWVAFGGACVVAALAPSGNISHREPLQVAALGSVLLWAPLGLVLYCQYVWPVACRRWLVAALGWWTLLLVTGLLVFLPGMLEQFKFTQVLVAHSHLAMAGAVGALAWAVLHVLDSSAPERPLLFALWQGGLLLFLGALVAAGLREVQVPGALYLQDAPMHLFLGLRFLGGLLLCAASVGWLWDAFKGGFTEAGVPRARLKAGRASVARSADGTAGGLKTNKSMQAPLSGVSKN